LSFDSYISMGVVLKMNNNNNNEYKHNESETVITEQYKSNAMA